ncbi:ATP-binding cassette domain-containing protein [Alkalihalobacillus sp. 1P02AB]|uniref:ATP-binding cassette domain-containing protein n=1 Tax=Alkalihalobacillus sp. 1P02AB TaxID=3132260 RepID=UPI0039A66C12
MLKIENLSFYYGPSLALNEVNLFEGEPIIAGLWGRNGAGKTTLMKLLSGQEKPTSGQLLVNGIAPYNHSETMKHVTYMQENHPFSELWNVDDALRFGSYFNENWDQAFAEEMVELFELPRKKKIRKFSKGMQTMIKIVIGLASKAPITIFDEPTNGLDAHMRKVFYQLLLDTYEDHPRLIILSSHHIDEIEPLCEKIAIIDKQTVSDYVETEELNRKGILLTGQKEQVESLIIGEHVLETKTLGTQIHVMVDVPFTEEWKERASEAGVKIEKAPLQDYLVQITQKERKEANVS